MIKILFFISGLSEGGAEKVLCSLVNNMDQDKFNITVQTIDEYDPERFLAKGIHYKAINKYKSKIGRIFFSYLFRFCAELKLAYRFFVKDNYDIEVAYLETIPTKIIAQSTNKKAKKLAWVHCDLSMKEGMQAVRDKLRTQYEQFDEIVCVSEDVKSGFHKLIGSDLDALVLPNVIDDEEIRAKADASVPWHREEDKIQLIALGRLTRQKNFPRLIKTCGRLRDVGCRFCLNILGEGPERSELEKQITDLKLDDFVMLKGFVCNPYPWIKQADVVVCSSDYEGISTVVQEALILCKPIVTTSCTGMKELLGESEYGMIVDRSEDGLYQGLYQMITDEDVRNIFREKAKERSALFRKSKVVDITEKFFASMLNSNQEEKN